MRLLPLVLAICGLRCAWLMPSQVEVKPGKLENGQPLQGAEGYKKAMAAYDYRRALDVAQAWLKESPEDAEAMLAVAAASNALADLSSNDKEASAHVDRTAGVLGPHMTGASQPTQPSALMHYLYAEALGIRLRSLGTGAIDLLPKVAEQAEKAYALGAGEEEGAPMRLLGMILCKAPPWPHGPGDAERGAKLLQESIDKFPRRAEGYVHYADVMLDQSRVQEAQRFLARGKELVGNNPRAKKLYLDVESRMRTNKKVKQYE